jgi:hypothetical protein
MEDQAMRTNRLALFGSCLLITVILGGWIHGSATPTLKGDTWKEALAQVPCQDVAKDGGDLKISGVILVVDGHSQPSPVIITKEDLIEVLDKKCFPKH